MYIWENLSRMKRGGRRRKHDTQTRTHTQTQIFQLYFSRVWSKILTSTFFRGTDHCSCLKTKLFVEHEKLTFQQQGHLSLGRPFRVRRSSRPFAQWLSVHRSRSRPSAAPNFLPRRTSQKYQFHKKWKNPNV